MLSCAHGSARVQTPVFQSRNPDEVVDYVARALAPHRMDAHNPSQMAAKLSCFEIASARIVDICYGTDVWIDPGELESHFLVHAAMQGTTSIWSGGVRGEMRPDNLYVSSPGMPIKIHMTPECSHLTVRIAWSAIEDYLARVMHISTSRPLVFYPARERGQDLPVAWRSTLGYIIDQTHATPALMANDRTQKQCLTLLIEMLLSHYSNSYSDRIALSGNDVAPWHVRRGRDIIHESLDRTISVSELAEQVGVSVRSLENGFRQFVGMTPTEYIRRHRLEKLHQALIDEDEDRSVTEMMLECGIVNFGRYAQYYRRQYGCRPSETLRNRRLV